jgi:hypothetical protein
MGDGWAKKGDETSIDQIKGVVRKIEWLPGIHHLKAHVSQALHLYLCTGVVDHRSADVEPNHLYLRIGKGHLLRPATWATTNIQDALDAREVGPLGKQPPHAFGNKAVLLEQSTRRAMQETLKLSTYFALLLIIALIVSALIPVLPHFPTHLLPF